MAQRHLIALTVLSALTHMAAPSSPAFSESLPQMRLPWDFESTPKGWALYTKIKAIGVKLTKSDQNIGADDASVELFPCQTWSEDLGAEGFGTKRSIALLDIAGYIVKWSAYLTAAKYPESVWKVKLEGIEKELVNDINTGWMTEDQLVASAQTLGENFAYEIDHWRLKSGSKLTKIAFQPECGAGGPVNIILKSDPPDGTISIISEFSYDLCELDGDPSDMKSCKGWRQNKLGVKELVSGTYYIQARWANKYKRPARFNLSNVTDGQTIWIKPNE